jgi:hypothetical protein
LTKSSPISARPSSLLHYILDVERAIARVERPGKIEQDRHGLITDRDWAPGHAAPSLGCGPRNTSAVINTICDGPPSTAGAIGVWSGRIIESEIQVRALANQKIYLRRGDAADGFADQ